MEENINETGPVEEGGGEKPGGENKKVLSKIIIILVVLVVLGVIYLLARESSQKGEIGEGANIEQKQEQAAPPASEPSQPAETTTTTEEELAGQAVLFTKNGYEPNELTIKKGETVVFTNTITDLTWPASAQHPTHTVYPGSDIKKCGTAEAGNIFDACKGLVEGESWTFTFNEVGAWNYHNHLNPAKFGKIVVEE